MNAHCIKLFKSNLCNIIEDEIVVSFKPANRNVNTSEQLTIPNFLIKDKFIRILNDSLFRDIQSRAIIIKKNGMEDEAVREQTIKHGYAFLPDTYTGNEIFDFVRFERVYYDFICCENFVHENQDFYQYVIINLIKLYNEKVDVMLIQGILTIIDTIEQLEIYQSNKSTIIKNIIAIIELVKTKKITNFMRLYNFSDELYVALGKILHQLGKCHPSELDDIQKSSIYNVFLKKYSEFLNFINFTDEETAIINF